MRKLFFLAVLFILIPTIALAAEFRVPPKTNTNAEVTLGKNEEARNLYTAGNLVKIEGKILSDLMVAGRIVNINNNVENDLFAAGEILDIKGDIGKTARVAAGNIYISGKIGEDLVFAGNSININKNAEINGDFIGAGSTLNVDGKVLGRAYLAGEDITINSEINGDVVIKNVNHLILGDSAKINGKLSYFSPNEAKISGNAQISGGTEYKKISESKYKWEVSKLTEAISTILISFVTLLVLVLLFPKFAMLAVEDASKNYWAKIGWGLFGLIAVPILSIFFIATIIGIKIAFISILLYVSFLLAASLLSPLIAGSYIVKSYKKSQGYKVDWMSALVGVIALSILSLVPVIGWILIMLLFLLSLGLLGTAAWRFAATGQK